MTNACDFYIGGYAEAGQAGITLCRFDADAGTLTALARNDELRNPSWLTLHPTLPVLYAVEEYGPVGTLAALDIRGGRLQKLGAWPTGGADPCHITVSPEGRHLLASNYTGGSLAVFALDDVGVPTGMSDFIQYRFPGGYVTQGVPQRQEAPHIHFTAFRGDQAFVCDLGSNRIVICGWDAGRLTERDAIPFPEGSGPRHIAFSADGRTLYALCELTGKLHVFRDALGRWTPVQVVPIIPDAFRDHARYTWSLSAAIHWADARTLCVSTRGLDTLAVLRVNDDGMLGAPTPSPAGVRTPRDFAAVGEYLLVAGQDDGRVVVLRRDAVTGKCALTGACLPAAQPTCLCRHG